jgi:hypothetical protein
MYATKIENCRPTSLMNVDATILNKHWHTEFNNASKRSYTMIKLVSIQRCRDGSTYAN